MIVYYAVGFLAMALLLVTTLEVGGEDNNNPATLLLLLCLLWPLTLAFMIHVATAAYWDTKP